MAIYKTKDISTIIGVNPTTIQRWTKFFNVACEVNDQGHFLYADQHIAQFKSIHQQLQDGKKLKEVQLKEEKPHSVPKKQYEAKLENVYAQVYELEEKMNSKADDVVSYQLLKHRSELDDMLQVLERLEERLTKIEERSESKQQQVVNGSPIVQGRFKKKTWKAIASFFTF